MPSYLVSVGDTDDGPIGLCARVKAPNRAAAIKRLQAALPHLAPGISLSYNDDAIEYAVVYFNTDEWTVGNIVESDTEDDDDEDSDETGAAA